MNKVAAYITAYEDKKALEKTILAIQRQSYSVLEIFIIDNSPKPILVAEYANIVVELHPENLGVAGGLKKGINWAIEKNYDFLWLFDQDSEPAIDALEKLVAQYHELSNKDEKIGIIAPTIFDINTQQEFPGCIFQEYKLIPISPSTDIKEFYRCDAVITSGCLVNIAAAKNVELPREDLFLDAVDYAYCLNFKKQGYEIIVVKNTLMLHRLGNYCEVTDRLAKVKKPVKTFICLPSRYYYACRNHTYFETRNSNLVNLHHSIFYRIKLLIDMLMRIIRYEPDLVLLKLSACILGTFDGLRGRLGKTW